MATTIAAVFAIPISDRIGRKRMCLTGAVITIVARALMQDYTGKDVSAEYDR